MDKSSEIWRVPSRLSFRLQGRLHLGFFRMRMKLPGKDSAGSSLPVFRWKWALSDELDFEFLGNRDGKPYTVQTNVFIGGKEIESRGSVSVRSHADFHDYKILWNPSQTVLLTTLVLAGSSWTRSRSGLQNKEKEGVKYPSKAMKIIGSIWNGEDWATDGGKEKIDWSRGPSGPASGASPSTAVPPAAAARRGGPSGTRGYLTYDYCSDRSRHPRPPPECPSEDLDATRRKD
ncbi:unnamed protein product [Spirodela intermedia]|uniref:Xyloglucan endotransglucosylase/hydrolase n=1 Tax=Spirodela intermedia TaxID=51605 RepID=A0A7I8IV77_SPIIN|nr:unnamed protein product [Spirodela intermedia]CAA6661473.1 unnamed protein product [Spirodela intermedia]